MKKQYEDFFTQLDKIVSNEKTKQVMNHYKNQIFYTKSLRDLNEFSHLINFYKSYYSKELKELEASHVIEGAKKGPVQKADIVFLSRQAKLDEFSRKCMISPIQLQENLTEEKQVHKPVNPKEGPTEMAKQYLRHDKEQALAVIKDMCTFTALELSAEPDIRRGLKKHIYEFGVLQTSPTEKGLKELDIFHPSYRVKRVSKKLSQLNDDLFIDILQHHGMGLIEFKIVIEDDCKDEKIGNKYFLAMLEKFKFEDDSTKWRFLRREIFEIISNRSVDPSGKATKSLYVSILNEIQAELKDDAEKFVLRECIAKYENLIQTGFFIRSEQSGNSILDQKKGDIHQDIIPQRERLTVMGVIVHPINNRDFLTTVAVVDTHGELVAHKDFLHIRPPKKRRVQEGEEEQPILERDRQQQIKHDEDKKKFQDILRDNQVDLIVVSADCLDAKIIKNAISDMANLQLAQDNM